MTTRAYIRPRKLDKRVRIDTRVVSKGASGGNRETWTAGPFVWAGISNKAGKEQRSTDAGGGLVAESDCEIEMRYRAGVTAENTRLVRGTTLYNIVHVDNVMEQNDRLILQCKSGVNDG